MTDSDSFRQRHIEQSKMYCESAEETLRMIEVRYRQCDVCRLPERRVD